MKKMFAILFALVALLLLPQQANAYSEHYSSSVCYPASSSATWSKSWSGATINGSFQAVMCPINNNTYSDIYGMYARISGSGTSCMAYMYAVSYNLEEMYTDYIYTTATVSAGVDVIRIHFF